MSARGAASDVAPADDAGRRAAHVAAWDGPTRLFKWLLVLLLVVAYVTQAQGRIHWHVLNGYAILILIVFRLLWGLVGSSTSRFSHWLNWPWTAARYAVALLRGRAPRFLGHNPLGAWMIVLLLLMVLAQALTGLFTVDSNGLEGGPFANLDFGDPTPTQRAAMFWHFRSFYWLLGFATVHILANLAYQYVKRDPVVTGMVTGSKPALAYADEPAMVPASFVWGRALACLLAAAAIVFGGVKLAGGALPF